MHSQPLLTLILDHTQRSPSTADLATSSAPPLHDFYVVSHPPFSSSVVPSADAPSNAPKQVVAPAPQLDSRPSLSGGATIVDQGQTVQIDLDQDPTAARGSYLHRRSGVPLPEPLSYLRNWNEQRNALRENVP